MLQISFRSRLGNWQEWGIIILLFLALVISVGSIEQAQWITPQPSLILVLVLAVLTGWVIYQSQLPPIIGHPLAIVLGAAITVWQASNLLPSPEIASRVSQLAVALQSWWQAVSTAEPSEGTTHFAVFLIFFTWMTGYISTWFILRRRSAWVAVFLGVITLLINLSNLPEQHSVFFFLYALIALLLVGMTGLAKRHYWFKNQGISYPSRSIIYFLVSLLCLSILAVSITWFIPEMRVERFETLVSTKTLWSRNIEKHFNNFLASVPAKQPFLRSDEKSSLLFGDSSFDHGDQLQFVVISEQPLYLRTRMYDIYTSSGWTSSDATEHTLRQGSHNTEARAISKRNEMTYTVIPKIRTDILLTGGEFVSSDIPVSVQSLAPPSFSIDLSQPIPIIDSSLPPDVAALAHSLRAARVANEGISLDKLRQLLPRDLALTDSTISQDSLGEAEYPLESTPISLQMSAVKVSRTQSASSEITAVTSHRPLRPERRYKVTASISSATPEDLSGAGDDYPHWVTDYYLQLPPTFPERIKQLSEAVTKGAKTPYDKALAIKHHLSQIDYRIEVKAPPEKIDGVDYFLFTQKTGNCVQFASTMAVMLRSINIPSRVSIGYAPGEWDATTGSYALTAKERHAWPEVYFSGYGWVGFEATPAANSESPIPNGSAGLKELPAWLFWEDEEGFDEWLEWLRWLKGQEQPEREKWLELMGWGEGELQEWLDWLEQQEQPKYAAAEQDPKVSSTATTSRNRWQITLLFTIGGTILLAFILRFLFSRRGEPFGRRNYASEVYRKMCFLASLAGLSPRLQQTPSEYGTRLASVFPQQVEALGNIVQTYIETQYSSRKELGRWERWRLMKSWREVHHRLIKRLFHIRH